MNERFGMCICVVDPDSRIVEISAKSGREASKPLILDGSGKIIYLRFELNQDQSQRVQKKKKKQKKKKNTKRNMTCAREREENGGKKKIQVIISSSCNQLPVCSI